MRLFFSSILFIFLFSLLTGCSKHRVGEPFGEGSIVYSMDFVANQKTSMNPKFLPNRLTIKFRNNNTTSKIEGLSGNVNLTYINNVRDQKCIVLVNLWNKKMCYQDDLSNLNIPNAYTGMQDITIEKTDQIVTFKGYRCKKAIAHYKDSTNHQFEILYTNDITITNPNANTPFSSIDGVMLKFCIKLHKYTINIAAESIEPKKISSDEFSIPSGYENVSKRTIEDLISLIQ